jgi:hypothetical protein
MPVERSLVQYSIVAIPFTPPPSILFGIRKPVQPKAIINKAMVVTVYALTS